MQRFDVYFYFRHSLFNSYRRDGMLSLLFPSFSDACRFVQRRNFEFYKRRLPEGAFMFYSLFDLGANYEPSDESFGSIDYVSVNSSSPLPDPVLFDQQVDDPLPY